LQSLERLLQRGARVVVVASLYGFPVDWDAVAGVLAPYGAIAIEDAAQGDHAAWRGRPLGSVGPISVLSFGRGKGWTGGGGGARWVGNSSVARNTGDAEGSPGIRHAVQSPGAEWPRHRALGRALCMPSRKQFSGCDWARPLPGPGTAAADDPHDVYLSRRQPAAARGRARRVARGVEAIGTGSRAGRLRLAQPPVSPRPGCCARHAGAAAPATAARLGSPELPSVLGRSPDARGWMTQRSPGREGKNSGPHVVHTKHRTFSHDERGRPVVKQLKPTGVAGDHDATSAGAASVATLSRGGGENWP
jgi:hypothetical protein